MLKREIDLKKFNIHRRDSNPRLSITGRARLPLRHRGLGKPVEILLVFNVSCKSTSSQYCEGIPAHPLENILTNIF